MFVENSQRSLSLANCNELLCSLSDSQYLDPDELMVLKSLP